MKKLIRAAAATVLGLSLTTGIAAAQTGSITKTGPGSSNHVSSNTRTSATVRNDNDLHVFSTNDQHSYTGDATAQRNTTAGDATSGSARNSNTVSVSATVDNSGSAAALMDATTPSSDASGTINNTGPNSSNTVSSNVKSTVNVTNDNDISVFNDNDQSASSGDATVRGNTTGGSATTGDASNTSSSTFTFDVTN